MAPRIYVGRFDPRFLGVTIRAISASDVHSFRYHERSRLAPPVLAGLSDDAVVSDLARRTVLEHEVRHFRDSLLFPFGAVAIRSRIGAAYNGFVAALMVQRLRSDANVLPVPLQLWLRMPPTERHAFLAGEAAFAGEDLRPPLLPVIPGDDQLSDLAAGIATLDTDEETLLASCRLALADYRMIEDIWRSPHPEGEEMVSPAIDSWEAAGLICQLAAIERYAGGPLMQRFIDWVARRGPQTYRRGLGLLNTSLTKLRWKPTMRNHLAVTTWAQMGAYETEMSESSPGYRLAALLTAAERGARS